MSPVPLLHDASLPYAHFEGTASLQVTSGSKGNPSNFKLMRWINLISGRN
ncbi:hypothetical protein [Arsenophonus sp.]